MVKIYTFFLLIFIIFHSKAQNEFYNNGAIVYVNNKVSSSIPTLRVNGEIVNNNGSFTNNTSLIELTGNWTNTSTSNYYVSTGIERFLGAANQTIYGTWNGTTSNQNQFYDLKVKKSAVVGEYVNLNVNTNVNSNGSLEFESTNGIIRSDVSSHTNNGSLYPYQLFLQNPDPTKLIGNSWTAVSQFSNTGGATTKYIEGKLRRAVSSNNTYNFPIGVAPSSLDGMEGVSVAFKSTFTTTDVIAYIQPAATVAYTSDLITNGGTLFYDIGSLPATSPANQFQNCVGTPDGHDDVAVIDAAITHEWILTASAATSNYDLSVHPGAVLDNLSYINMGTPCNSVYPKTKYIARNGKIGGDEAVGPTTNYWVPGATGLYQKPNGNKLTAQTGFSRFRLFGTTIPANTSLPVELVNLNAEAINNEFIKVSWITASESNNKGFILQRSYNNSTFDSIAWIAGNGTTNTIHNYIHDDQNVEKGIIYYYRLKQIDYDNTYSFSNTVSAQLIPSNVESVNVFPNPSNTNTTIQILSTANDQYNLEVFNDIGQNMYANKIEVKANTTTNVNLPSADWAKGMYFIKAQSNNKQKTTITKFIKN
jgi:hypothetical protein